MDTQDFQTDVEKRLCYVCTCYSMPLSTCIFTVYVCQRLLNMLIFNFFILLLVNRKDVHAMQMRWGRGELVFCLCR